MKKHKYTKCKYIYMPTNLINVGLWFFFSIIHAKLCMQTKQPEIIRQLCLIINNDFYYMTFGAFENKL